MVPPGHVLHHAQNCTTLTLPLQQSVLLNLLFLMCFYLISPFAGRVRPCLPSMAGWRCVLRYMAISLSDASVCNWLMHRASDARNACALEKTHTRQVSFLQGKRDIRESHTYRMKVKIDSETSREMITCRLATVESVFGNLRGNKRLLRFSLRGKTKADGR